MRFPLCSSLASCFRRAYVAVLLAVALLPATRAAIVFTDVGGLGTGGPISIFLDLGASGAPGSANNNNTFFAEADFRIYMFASNNFRPTIDGVGGAIVAFESGFAKNFDLGESISSADGGSLFLNDPSGSNPNWAFGTRGYLGVQFVAGTSGSVNGWIDVAYGPFLTLFGFAYESSGAPIIAGDMGSGVPEPATTAMLAGLTVVGFALYARRRSTADVS